MYFLLYPETNIKLINLYNLSSKLMISIFIPNIYLSNTNYFKKYFYTINLINLSFNSYMNIAYLIKEYQTILLHRKLLRVTNLYIHSLAIYWFSNQLRIKKII